MTDIAAGAAASAAAAPEAAVADEASNWNKVIIVAGGSIPDKLGGAKVIVVEQRSAAKFDEKTGEKVSGGEVRASGYPKGADLYYRTEDTASFPDDAEVITLGDNAVAKGVGGFAARGLRVGPGHPAYAAANLAHQRGAKEIQIVGLKAADQELLQPWFDSPKMPQGVAVTFS